MKFEAYLFDLDNCILKYPEASTYFNDILIKTSQELFNHTPTPTEIETFWGLGFEIDKLLILWGTCSKEIFWRTFDRIDVDSRSELIDAGVIHLFDDVVDVLTLLKQNSKKMALISNSPSYIVDLIIEKFQLAEFFHTIIGMDYVNNGKYAKPSGYFLKHTLKEFNIALSQETALYIGDSQVDIMAACDAGIASCLINRQNAKKNRSEDWKAKPTYIISDFHELLKI